MQNRPITAAPPAAGFGNDLLDLCPCFGLDRGDRVGDVVACLAVGCGYSRAITLSAMASAGERPWKPTNGAIDAIWVHGLLAVLPGRSSAWASATSLRRSRRQPWSAAELEQLELAAPQREPGSASAWRRRRRSSRPAG